MGTSIAAWRSSIAALVFALSVPSMAVSAPLVGHGSNATFYDLDLDTGAALNPRDVGTTPLIGISLSNDGVLFGVGFNDRVYTIDPIAGTSQLVGLLGFSIGEGDIAFDPTTGTLYGLAFVDSESARHLFTIDTETGLGTDVGAIPVPSLDPSAMVIDDAGDLYVLDTFHDELLQIDKTDGAVLLSVELSLSLGSTAGMDIDPDTGEFYVADGGGGATNSLYTLDHISGELSLIGPTGLGQGLSGIEFIPEPGTLTLLLLGALGMVRSRRSRTA